jgi:hypothetical protein
MRIGPDPYTFHFYHNPTKIQPTRDMHQLFNGDLRTQKSMLGLTTSTHKTWDGQLVSTSKAIEGFPSNANTTIEISNLSSYDQAGRWLAVCAYRTKYHQGFKDHRLRYIPLKFIVPRHPAAEGIVGHLAVPNTKAYSAHPSMDPEDFSGSTVIEASDLDTAVAAEAAAKCYQELFQTSEIDATAAVAFALGAVSLEHLKESWQDAMKQATPIEAGRATLAGLANF